MKLKQASKRIIQRTQHVLNEQSNTSEKSSPKRLPKKHRRETSPVKEKASYFQKTGARLIFCPTGTHLQCRGGCDLLGDAEGESFDSKNLRGKTRPFASISLARSGFWGDFLFLAFLVKGLWLEIFVVGFLGIWKANSS